MNKSEINKSINKSISRNQVFKSTDLKPFWLASFLLLLTACSTASEHFDSEATKGVGAKSISEVNRMIDQGKIEGVNPDGSTHGVVAPVVSHVPVPKALAETMVLSDQTVVHRQPEEYLRVWIAPFQDNHGNLYEASVVHTLFRPGFWQMSPAIGTR
jgi:conjugal transfer pilus assembly protein TraV